MGAALECRSCGADVPLTGGDVVSCPNPDCDRTYEGLGGLGGGTSPRTLPGEREKTVEERIITLYSTLGHHVYKTSQYGKPKGMTPGIPDLIVIPGSTSGRYPPVWFHEVKPTDDEEEARRKQTPAQERFEELVERAGGVYLLGGVGVARSFLGLDG